MPHATPCHLEAIQDNEPWPPSRLVQPSGGQGAAKILPSSWPCLVWQRKIFSEHVLRQRKNDISAFPIKTNQPIKSVCFFCSPSSSTNARKRSPSNSMTHTNVTVDARPLHCLPTTLDRLTNMYLMAPATHIPLHHWQNIASPPHYPDSQIHLKKLWKLFLKKKEAKKDEWKGWKKTNFWAGLGSKDCTSKSLHCAAMLM